MEVKLNVLKRISLAFGGAREDHNKVEQLKKNNDYALTNNNQRQIGIAIQSLAKDSSAENVDFLMDVASHLRYATKLDLGKKPNNDWQQQLRDATRQALDNMDSPKKADFEKRFKRVFLAKKQPGKTELDLLELKKQILENTSVKYALKRPADKNIENIPKNLDYFIISSEISLAEKKKVLEKLNFLLSKDYKINSQLRNKKVKVLSEILNDIIIRTPESPILNTKQVDQGQHGMCAAISICRKALAYEDKAKYVDIILSELDNTDKLMVYDILKLKSGEKIPIAKTYVDFDYAQQRDYRIIDASALQWMSAAGRVCRGRRVANNYVAFDKGNFDVFHDSFLLKDFDDADLNREHYYLRTLIKAKEAIVAAKSSAIKAQVSREESRVSKSTDVGQAAVVGQLIDKKLNSLMPGKSIEEVRLVAKDLIDLLKRDSKTIQFEEIRGDKISAKYKYIPNEEGLMKAGKTGAFLREVYGVNIDDKNQEELYGLISDYQSITKSSHKKVDNRFNAREYRKLFDAQAAYKLSMAQLLTDSKLLDQYAFEYNLPDDETRLITHLNKLVEVVNGPDGNKYVQLFAQRWNMEPKKEVILEELKGIASEVEEITQSTLNDFYAKMLLGDKKNALLTLTLGISKMVQKGTFSNLEGLAKRLHTRPTTQNVAEKLAALQQELKGPVSEERYKEIMKSLGYNSQMKLLVSVFNLINPSLVNLDITSQGAKDFADINGIKLNERSILKAVNDLSSEINELYNYLNNVDFNSTVINDEEGVFLTSNARLIITRKLENKGEFLSDKDLRRLHNKFLAISSFKEKAERALVDENIKLKVPEELKFTDYELSLFKKIHSDLNKMYHDVIREYTRQNKCMEEPLADVIRKVGKETGHFWVREEGESGLYPSQQIRIFEQMTGREYYAEEDPNKIADKIKNGNHSGISGTSVYHTERAGHAQYIADVAPVRVIDEKTGKVEVKDAIMHDNSWNQIEHLNTWVDSQGLMRTDYSNKRGGANGYITDAQSRNGTLLQDFLEKPGEVEPEDVNSKLYKRLKPADEPDKFRLITDAVITGRGNDVRETAGQMVQTIFSDYFISIREIQQLAALAKKMTPVQLENAFLQNKQIDNIYEIKRDRIMKIINNQDSLHPMRNVEDYNKLNDFEFKIALRKLAVSDSYYSPVIIDKVKRATTFAQLDEIEKTIPHYAKENFRYAFGKTREAVPYFALLETSDLKSQLDLISKKYNVQFSKYDLKDLYYKSEGSLSEFIALIKQTLSQSIDAQLSSRSDATQVQKELNDRLTKVLESKILFQKDDLNTDMVGFNKIKRFIDKTYSPKTDEEFIAAYRKLQNMKKVDFEKILAKVSNEDLGIEKKTEFSYIRGIQNADDKAEEKLLNAIFSDVVYARINKSKKKPIYSYEKFTKKHAYTVYEGKREFVEMYRDMNVLFENMDIEKAMNKHKNEAFRKYGARPVYPKQELMTKEISDDLFDRNIAGIDEDMQQLKSLKRQYNVYKLLDEFNASIRNNNYELFIEATERFAQYSEEDQGLEDVQKAAKYILANSQEGSIDFFAPQYRAISNNINSYRRVTSDKELENLIDQVITHKTDLTKMLVDMFITPRNRDKVGESFKKYTMAMIQDRPQDAHSMYENLKAEFYQYNIMRNPEEQLKEFLRLMNLNKNVTDKNFVDTFGQHIQQTISAALRSELEYFLINAAGDGFVHKLRDELMTYRIPTGMPNAGMKLSSDTALAMMIDSISYQANNNDTLMLFLNQTGLSERALDLSISETDLQEHKQQLDDFYAGMIALNKAYKVITSQIDVMEKSRLPKDKDAFVDTLYRNIENKLKANKIDLPEYLNITKEYIYRVKEENFLYPQDISALINNLHLRASYNTNAYVKDKVNEINSKIMNMNEFIQYISDFEFPENSEPQKKLEAFISKINKLMDYQRKVVGKVPAVIESQAS